MKFDWHTQANNLFSALPYTSNDYNDMQWSQISTSSKAELWIQVFNDVKTLICMCKGKHAWQKEQLLKDTDFLIVLFEFRYCPTLPSGVFLNSFLSPIDCCLSSGWYVWHKHKGDTYSQHWIWLFPTTPVIQQPQGLEDTSVSRCSSCHLHELHYLTALALINICCNLW